MGMGYGANMAVVITTEEILKLELPSFLKLYALLEQHEVELDELASCIAYNDTLDNISESEGEEIFLTYEAFQQDFKELTGIGIELSYHSSNNEGDYYDDVDGGYFALDWSDVYVKSDKAKDLKEKVQFECQYYVTYG